METEQKVSVAVLLATLVLIPGTLQGWVVHMPIEYFTFLRTVVFIATAYLAWRAAEEARVGWMWLFIVGTIIYNPIVPFHFNEPVWSWDTWPSLDVGMIVLLFTFANREQGLTHAPVQTNKCVWCQSEFKEGEKRIGDGFTKYGLEQVEFGNPVECFSICGYCYEGLIGIGNRKVMHMVLSEAKRYPDRKRGRGYNDFLNAARRLDP